MAGSLADYRALATAPDPTYNYAGLAPAFAAALDRFITDNPYVVTLTDGFRTRAQQADLYARKPNLAAPPGSSNHEKGRAADIGYENPQARQWAQQNAAAYGLRFPMSYEPWHVEPIDKSGGTAPVNGSVSPEAGQMAVQQPNPLSNQPVNDGLGALFAASMAAPQQSVVAHSQPQPVQAQQAAQPKRPPSEIAQAILSGLAGPAPLNGVS